jgi:beta-lactamase regulating signal transducer with metallopeptidase domain
LWALPFLRLFMPDISLPIKQDINVLSWPARWGAEFSGAAPLEPPAPAAGIAPPTGPFTAQSGFDVSTLAFIMVGLWIFIGGIWFIWQLTRHFRYWRLLNHVGEPARDDLLRIAQRAAHIIGLRRLPVIKIAPAVIGPMVSGSFRPLIILPQNFADHYTVDEQLYALCHEMAHIKRFDLWAALALLFFRAVHWYNPLVHFAAKRFRVDQEAACDAFLLAKLNHHGAGADTPFHYAKTLIKAEHAANLTGKGQALSLGLIDKE